MLTNNPLRVLFYVTIYASYKKICAFEEINWCVFYQLEECFLKHCFGGRKTKQNISVWQNCVREPHRSLSLNMTHRFNSVHLLLCICQSEWIFRFILSPFIYSTAICPGFHGIERNSSFLLIGPWRSANTAEPKYWLTWSCAEMYCKNIQVCAEIQSVTKHKRRPFKHRALKCTILTTRGALVKILVHLPCCQSLLTGGHLVVSTSSFYSRWSK